MKNQALLLVGLLCLAGLAGAMVSTNYNLGWHVIGGGGGPMSSSNYRMDGTVGQIIGLSSSENYQLEAGYWSGILVDGEPPELPRWDINEDGEVDDVDLGLLLLHYGETTSPPYPRWDINEDGEVDDVDLGLLLLHYGE